MFNFIKEKIFVKKEDGEKLKITKPNTDETRELELKLNKSNIDKAFKDLDEGIISPSDSWHNKIINMLHDKECKQIDLFIIENEKIDSGEINLKSKEILFLDYIKGWSLKNNEFPKYWTYEYRLPLQDTIEKLNDYGFICLADAKTSLNSLTVKEIKEILKENELKVSGRKADLIDRLIENLDKDYLKDILPSEFVGLADKAEILIDENQHIFLNIGLSIYELDKAYDNGVTDFHQYAINKYMKLREENWNNYEAGLARNNYSCISKIYEDKKDIDNQLEYLIKVLAEDICEDVLSKYFLKKKSPHLSEKHYKEMSQYYDSIMIAPGIINPIKKISKKLEIEHYIIEKKIHDHILTLPISISNKEFQNRIKLIKDN